MSLIVTVYVPGGIVMAGDSRISASRVVEHEGKSEEMKLVLSDHTYKVVALTRVPVGIAHAGDAILQNQAVESHVRAFEEEEVKPGDGPFEVAEKLSAFFRRSFPGANVAFHVGGHQLERGISVPHVYALHTQKQPEPKRVNTDVQGNVQYGILRSGDTLVVDRLITKEYLPPFAAMPIQDAIEYAIYLIDVTIKTLRFEPRFPSVGGAIDVLLITPEGSGFVQRKELHGESASDTWKISVPRSAESKESRPSKKKR